MPLANKEQWLATLTPAKRKELERRFGVNFADVSMEQILALLKEDMKRQERVLANFEKHVKDED